MCLSPFSEKHDKNPTSLYKKKYLFFDAFPGLQKNRKVGCLVGWLVAKLVRSGASFLPINSRTPATAGLIDLLNRLFFYMDIFFCNCVNCHKVTMPPSTLGSMTASGPADNFYGITDNW